jgi:hypothetical protein
MTLATWLGLGYVVVGLIMSAFVYHAFSGGMDDWFKDEAGRCEGCGEVHPLSDDEREIGEHLSFMATLRNHEQGRVLVAVVAAFVCLMTTLAWPGVLIWVIVEMRRAKSK